MVYHECIPLVKGRRAQMLVVRALDDQSAHGIRKGDILRFYIIDAHHHMGREGSHRNTPAGAYYFYSLLWFELRRMAAEQMEKDSLLFEPVDVEPSRLISECFNLRDSWAAMNHGWLVDRTIVFPFSDDYAKSEKKLVASFKLSNDRIAGWTTKAPHSTRLIGFARVDPTDARTIGTDSAVNELQRAVKVLGLRGLKLHPLAQLFLDDIEDDITKRVVKKAGELQVPIIFDARNVRTVRRIRNLIEGMRLDQSCRDSIAGMRVIIGHSAMSPNDTFLHETLIDPIFYTETSGLHGQDLPVLFKTAYERIRAPGLGWSDKILFGTDYSFLSVQAAEAILHLLSRDFVGTPSDISRILGGNALSLVQKPFVTRGPSSRRPRQVAFRDNHSRDLEGFENLLLSLVKDGSWDVSSLDLMIPVGGISADTQASASAPVGGIDIDSYVLTFKSRSDNEEVHIWVRRRSDKLVSCAVMTSGGSPGLDAAESGLHGAEPLLLKTLDDHTLYAESFDALSSEVLEMLRKP
jgi:predicted TIM-barrel fold metal-dependent hydrolase